MASPRAVHDAAFQDEETDPQSVNRAKRKEWEKRYQFFSSTHMKRQFRAFTDARHDPFNKDPSWCKAMLNDLGKSMAKQGLKPTDFFHKFDTKGDGLLDRQQMKQALHEVLPGFSDPEFFRIFDAIDTNMDGLVGISELSAAVEQKREFSQDSMERWRNPIHRVSRLPPARPEGWEHLVGSASEEHDAHALRKSQCLKRLAANIPSGSPRALRNEIGNLYTKYNFFNGGNDDARFRRLAWREEKREKASLPTLSLPDPGDVSPRPGFLVTQGFKAFLSPRQMSMTAR
eukprot:TRINITY_DN41963_c0_g1_i1.p1 TRINITY_DN41963_c0_g1~~TRINITY_DN41963_c0_g1_i1.p1  ORF type:complete len:299 (-),score=53.86 TRINITY_DN41963_c0_g1_i1:16-876(-)